jgi:hypothetical protein
MTSFRYFIPALVAVVMPVIAQKSTCDLVTQSEAAAIIGTDVEKRPFASTCLYKSKTSTLSLHLRIGKKDSATIAAAKDRITKSGGTVKGEPSLGKDAYSALALNSNRIVVFKGDKMLTIDYRDSTPAKIPSGPMDKLRAAAKTALGRL